MTNTETTRVKLIDIDVATIIHILPDMIAGLSRKYRYDVTIIKHPNKKSVVQNAYFHKLVDMLSSELSKEKGMSFSFTRMKNELIASYGTILSTESIMLTVPPEAIREWERPHVKYIKSETVIDRYGVEIEGHWYRLYKNVQDMTVPEMAKLISGTVQECENVGLDVMTPSEKEYLKELMSNAETFNSGKH